MLLKFCVGILDAQPYFFEVSSHPDHYDEDLLLFTLSERGYTSLSIFDDRDIAFEAFMVLRSGIQNKNRERNTLAAKG